MSPSFRFWLIKLSLPFATWWVEKQERRILRDGHELSDEEKRWARQVGVGQVDKVRVLSVKTVPLPGSPVLPYLANLVKCPVVAIGLAARYGIYLEHASRNNPALLVHELVHVAQYERLGGNVRAFLDRYLEECMRDGYEQAEMELEARCAAMPFNRPPNR